MTNVFHQHRSTEEQEGGYKKNQKGVSITLPIHLGGGHRD